MSPFQGKSLSTMCLLHTVMTAMPSLIRTVLLVVPVNTMANWENGMLINSLQYLFQVYLFGLSGVIFY